MKIAVEVYSMYEQVGGDGGDPTEANELLGSPSVTLEEWLQSKLMQREKR